MSNHTYKPKLIITWILLNACILALAIAALFYSVVWAGNVFKFILWFFTVIYLFACASGEAKAEMQAKGPSVPTWATYVFDLSLACLLAACGWFFYAGLLVAQMSLYLGIHAKPTAKAEAQP